MKAGFVTCVQLGATCIDAIYEAGGTLDVVLTLRDDLARKKSGRVYLDDLSASRRFDLVKIRHINDDDAIAELQRRQLDWLFIIGWSQVASSRVLETASRGVLGAHPTLLPEGRGRAAIPWAIVKGLQETGVTLFKLDTGVDTGPILAQERLAIAPRETATTLYSRVADAHQTLISNSWPMLASGTAVFRVQDETRATVWPGRTPDDGRLLPEMTVAAADALIRASTRPYPGAFLDRASQRLRIWAARPLLYGETPTGEVLRFADGALQLEEFEVEPLS